MEGLFGVWFLVIYVVGIGIGEDFVVKCGVIFGCECDCVFWIL